MLNALHAAYERSPPFVRAAYSRIPLPWRMGRSFRATMDLLRRARSWDAATLADYQSRELNRILSHAVRTVPRYRDVPFDERKPGPENLQSFPIVGKDDLQRDYQRFLSSSHRRASSYLVTTGGTSGNQLKFVLDNTTYGVEWAYLMDVWSRTGYRPGDRLASFRGVPFRDPASPLWQDDPLYNNVQFSPFAMSEANLGKYVEKLKSWRPRFLWGYPSALTILAKHVLRHEPRDFPKVRGVLCASENVYPDQRVLIERAFGARFLSWYGQSEKVILAGECEASSKYHCEPTYGWTELVDAEDRPISTPGVRGELVGTGFMHRSLPFIRYRTGDFAQLSPESCPCGRRHPLIEAVSGHWTQELLVARDGALISMTALNMHSRVFERVERFQFHQSQPGRAVLRILPGKGFEEADVAAIRRALWEKVRDGIDIEVETVDEIPLTGRGKHKLLRQELDLRKHGWNDET